MAVFPSGSSSSAKHAKQQNWWAVLESASSVLQYELYATIVRLSNVEWKLQQQERGQWHELDNLLRSTRQIHLNALQGWFLLTSQPTLLAYHYHYHYQLPPHVQISYPPLATNIRNHHRCHVDIDIDFAVV